LWLPGNWDNFMSQKVKVIEKTVENKERDRATG
jgi:hypothetical protein